MNTQAAKRRHIGWGLCLLCAGVLVLLSLACCHLAFETNDDNGIVAITSGAFTGSPYAGNGYTSYAYGALLMGLYTLLAGMPWHTVLLLLLTFLSLAAMLKAFLTACARYDISIWVGACAFLAFYIGVLLTYVVKLQYTTVAAFAATAGACLFFTLPGGERYKDYAASMVVAAVLLLFSIALRQESFWACMPLLLGFCLVHSVQKHSVRALLPCAMVLCGAVLFMLVDGALYRANEPNWETFRTFYDLRCGLLDYNNTDLMEHTATQVLGWPEATVRMLRNWYMLDEHVSTEGLSALLTAVEAAKPQPTLFSLLKATGSILRRYPMFALNFAAFGLWALVSVVLFARRKEWMGVLRIVGVGVYVAVFIAYFYGVLNRLPERAAFAVACPGYAWLVLACLPAWGGKREPAQYEEDVQRTGNSGRWGKRLLAACMGLMLMAGAYTLVVSESPRLRLRWQGPVQTAREALSENIRLYAQAHPGTVYVTDIPQTYGPLYTAPTAAVNLVEWGHAMYGSDMFRAKEQANGFAAMDTDSLFDPRVRIIITDTKVEMLLAYLREGHSEVQMQAEDVGTGFTVYRLTRRE